MVDRPSWTGVGMDGWWLLSAASLEPMITMIITNIHCRVSRMAHAACSGFLEPSHRAASDQHSDGSPESLGLSWREAGWPMAV